MFDLDIPGGAVWSKIPDIRSSANKRIAATCVPVGDVGELSRTVEDLTVWTIIRDDLFRVLVESEDAQGDSVIEESITSANDRVLIVERSPGESDSWSPAIDAGNGLAFESQSQIHCQFWRHDPVILAEEMCFEVGQIKSAAGCEIDPLKQLILQIKNVDRSRCDSSAVGRSGNDAAEFKIVSAKAR